MNQNQPPFDEGRQYPGFPGNEGQHWIEENQTQHYQQENNDFQSQGQEYEQQDRQFPWQQGGPFQGFPGGQPPGVGFPGQPQPGNQFPGQMPPFGGGGQSAGPPNSPPPSFTPTEKQFQTFAVDPGAIRGCLFRFTYVWLDRDQFWFFPTFVGRNSVAGFRWRRNRWVYFGIDLNRIQSFQCY